MRLTDWYGTKIYFAMHIFEERLFQEWLATLNPLRTLHTRDKFLS